MKTELQDRIDSYRNHLVSVINSIHEVTVHDSNLTARTVLQHVTFQLDKTVEILAGIDKLQAVLDLLRAEKGEA
tara:strand:- start:8794 stop:9015 length:222 start_codon:yes stop_codon:yes gene_type:complete